MVSDRKFRLCAGAALLALLAPATAAPPRGAPVKAAPSSFAANDLYQYRVQPGDSLRNLANDYFINPRDKAALRNVASINHLKGDRLASGSALAIPRRYLSLVPARALVAAFRGQVSLGNGRPVKVNSVVTEGARIETGANSSVSFTLEDGSQITLPSQSVFVLERLRLLLISGELQHVFRLDKGRSQFAVTPARGPASRFEVKTPVSVSAVRGTEFRIAVEDEGKSAASEVLKDTVQVTGLATGSGTPVNQGFGVKASDAGVGKPVKLLPYPEVVPPVFHNPDGSLTFNVKPVDGAARYRLQIAADISFQDVREEKESNKPTFNSTAPAGNYYVKLTAVDGQGLEGLQHIYPFEYRK